MDTPKKQSFFFQKKHKIAQLETENQLLRNQLTNLQNHYNEDCKSTISAITKRLLFINLDQKNVYLIDYENITMIPKFILEDKQSVCYIFSGQNQQEKFHHDERIHDFKGIHYNIPAQRTAKNTVDTLLSFYLGQIYSAFTPQSVFIVSNDKDYENLRRLSSYYPNIHYEQITLNEIKRKQQNVSSDVFFKRFLLDYIHAYHPSPILQHTFMSRLRASKVHAMDTSDVQYALKRMEQLRLIEAYTYHGKRYIRFCIENIQKLHENIPKFQKNYVY